MKKQNLNKLLGASAVFTGVVTYLVVKLTVMPLLQFTPFILYALVLLLVFSKHIRKHHERWSGQFSTLLMTWLLAMGTMFLLFYTFPVEGMLPREWTLSETAILLSVNISFAFGVALVLTGIIHTVMGNITMGNQQQARKAGI